ncbi:MlaA family lipoprotein [Psittacicella gerlachiana]|uniref:Phospholipid-binding lipoprotein MlaA n=1 Tax=Psittacicella gerlachiana TaxID=2028574 RepID=A0A3A1YBM8_9GAMM|nr:MlaA family lipoprotein [Psittacicella gerlachiana]RIY33614.1 hypothetical protein CKF59_06260 [Psittacicella gerlachiana]
MFKLKQIITTLALTSLLASCAGVNAYKEQAKIPLTPEPEQTVEADGVVLNSQGIDFGKAYRAYVNNDLDRFQAFNRWSFNLNTNFLDRYFLRPLAVLNMNYVSPDLQNALVNFSSYLDEPATLVSNLATGQFKESGKDLTRILVNGIFGLGMIDWASAMGVDSNGNNFDFALAYYNVKPGSYWVLPGYNSTVTRKFIAQTLVQNSLVSAGYSAIINGSTIYITLPLNLYTAIVSRGQLISQENMVFAAQDPYAMFKSIWIQNYNFNLAKATGKPQPQASESSIDLDLLNQFN